MRARRSGPAPTQVVLAPARAVVATAVVTAAIVHPLPAPAPVATAPPWTLRAHRVAHLV